MSSRWIGPFTIVKWISLSMAILFALKSSLYYINIAVPAFVWLVLLMYIFFHILLLLTYLCLLFEVQFFWRQHISWVLFYLSSMIHRNRGVLTIAFNVIIDMSCLFISFTLLFVFHLFYLFFVSFFLIFCIILNWALWFYFFSFVG